MTKIFLTPSLVGTISVVHAYLSLKKSGSGKITKFSDNSVKILPL